MTSETGRPLSTTSELTDEQNIYGENSYPELESLISRVYNKYNSVMLGAYGLSDNRIAKNVLWQLAKVGPLTSKQLSENIKASKGALSAVIKNLRASGIIRITKERGAHGSEPLEVTEEYLGVIRDHIDHVERLIQSVFNVLSEDEKAGLTTSLHKVFDKLDAIGQELATKPKYRLPLGNQSERTSLTPNASEKKQERRFDDQETADPRSGERMAEKAEAVTIIERQTRIVSEIFEKEIHHKR